MEEPQFTKIFSSGKSAKVIFIDKTSRPEEVISKLNHNNAPKAIIPISGGAYDYPPDVIEPTNRLIQALLELAFEHHIMLVDGGTHTGVMRLIGNNFLKCSNELQHLPHPLVVGISPKKKVIIPGDLLLDNDLASLDENHPYFVLINDADDWGGEVENMFDLVDYVSLTVPSVALVANGGLTTLEEVTHSVQKNRQIVVLEGTMRAAKLIVLAIEGASMSTLENVLTDPDAKLIKPDSIGRDKKIQSALSQLAEIRNYPKIMPFNLHKSPDELKRVLSGFLNL